MEKAVVYLKAAAENAAEAEDDALAHGLMKGGNLKGELGLAIFELGNCFRNGWGVEKDNKVARQYFETAAHLGDAEAAVEAAWHWMNGVGCKRNKKQAAKYYRYIPKLKG
jgi:TPR repeat protein